MAATWMTNFRKPGTMDRDKLLAVLAVTVLDDLIAAAEPQPPVKILVGAELILRASREHAHRRRSRTAQRARRNSPRNNTTRKDHGIQYTRPFGAQGFGHHGLHQRAAWIGWRKRRNFEAALWAPSVRCCATLIPFRDDLQFPTPARPER